MKSIVLIGTEGGKRTAYFKKAAESAGVGVSFYSWENFRLAGENADLKRQVVKIDAPEWKSCRLEELSALTEQYEMWLMTLSQMPFGAFLNQPGEIVEVLDKRKCKKRLIQNGIPVTRQYEERFSDTEALLSFMREKQLGQVFIKPVKGSGAAGVSAFRFSPMNRKMVLYTCAALSEGSIFNTKKLYRLEGSDAADFLDRLLELDCVVERWYRKADVGGFCYDLRVIVQDGKIDYILARLSKGPITNLQLNNHSMDFEDLNLDADVTRRMTEVCIRAAGCYPGLKSVGIDVLLEKGSKIPYIIEMNAQGDLLHRDIYGENRIYRRQIEIMRELLPEI